jgi:hypothetical protein
MQDQINALIKGESISIEIDMSFLNQIGEAIYNTIVDLIDSIKDYF